MIGDVGQPSAHTSRAGLRRLLPQLFARIDRLERPLAAAGILIVLLGTIPELATRYDSVLTLACLGLAALFAVDCALRLWSASSLAPDENGGGAEVAGGSSPGTVARLRRALTGEAAIDLLAAVPIPLALLLDVPQETARLFGMLWALKLVRFDPAFLLLAHVIRNERQPLASVTMIFVVVVLLASTLAFLVERSAQPEAFGSIPATLWWAVTTVTTTGYGDKIPASLAGRTLAGILMVCGIGMFALWAGILASGFSQELRRSEFLRTWDLVVRLPLFRNLGAPALSEITRLLKVQRCPAGSLIVQQGQTGDSMYFIAEGEVEVQVPSGRIRLGPGKFFGEMALITGGPRNATIVAVSPTRLLRLDVVDFRDLAARQPELLQLIEAEGTRRAGGDADQRG